VKTGQIDIRATALTPIYHSRGTIGNVGMVRTEELMDGSRVPFVTGNSFKGRLRRAGAQFLMESLGIRLSKAQVDLLFSGGHLSKGGGSIDLHLAREVQEKIPLLSLLGYSAGNAMTESKLRCAHWHVACEENSFRMPRDMKATHRAGQLITTEFGTRMDVGLSQASMDFLASSERTPSDRESEDESEDSETSSQMIYEFQAIKAGAHLWSSLSFRQLEPMEWAAFLSALAALSSDCAEAETETETETETERIWHLGGKSAIGYGVVRVQLGDFEIPRATEEPIREYVEYLRQHKDAVTACIQAIA
jgi:hypothetical protein